MEHSGQNIEIFKLKPYQMKREILFIRILMNLLMLVCVSMLFYGLFLKSGRSLPVPINMFLFGTRNQDGNPHLNVRLWILGKIVLLVLVIIASKIGFKWMKKGVKCNHMNKMKENINLLMIFLKDFVNKQNIWTLITLLGITILRSFILLMPAYYIMRILDEAIPKGNLNQVILFAVFAIVFTILDSSLEIILSYINTSLSRTVYLNYQKRCVKHLFSLSGEYYSNIHTGELLMVLNGDIEKTKDIFSSVILSFFSQVVTSLVMIIILAKLQFDLLLIVILFFPILFISQRYFQNKVKEKYQKLREYYSELMSAIEGTVSNITKCIMLKNNSFFEDKVACIATKATDKEVKVNVWNSINGGSINFLASVVIILVLGLGGYKVAEQKMTIGILMMFYMNLGKLVSPVIRLSSVLMQFQMMLVSIRKIHEFLETKASIKITTSGVKHDSLINKNSIIFKNVQFSYDDHKNLFEDLSFEICENSFNALVGASGSGKSTIASLLYRFWDCNSGKILLHEENIQQYDIEYVRECITIVSQDVFIFDDTIYNNIVVGRKDITLDQVKKVCEHTQIATYIEGLPEKYNTIVGEKGVKLSGGERQRISIARCLLNVNSDIYIFDEATSALDQLTEKLIIQNIREYLKEKIIIFITHRIAAISEADRIYVINNGMIVEKGVHNELLGSHGYYYELNINKSVDT